MRGTCGRLSMHACSTRRWCCRLPCIACTAPFCCCQLPCNLALRAATAADCAQAGIMALHCTLLLLPAAHARLHCALLLLPALLLLASHADDTHCTLVLLPAANSGFHYAPLLQPAAHRHASTACCCCCRLPMLSCSCKAIHVQAYVCASVTCAQGFVCLLCQRRLAAFVPAGGDLISGGGNAGSIC
jgi:hypothetical protein